MKEFIVDFELYEGGVVTAWLQSAFQFAEDLPDGEEFNSFFEYFVDYAKGQWGVEDGVRITKVWTITE